MNKADSPRRPQHQYSKTNGAKGYERPTYAPEIHEAPENEFPETTAKKLRDMLE